MPWMLPKFRPYFPSEFVNEARRMVARQKVARRLWQRAKLVLLLHGNANLSNTAAAAEVGLSDQWVRKWRRRWDSGDFSLDDRLRSGRPPGVSPRRAIASQSCRV
jgi:transposase